MIYYLYRLENSLKFDKCGATTGWDKRCRDNIALHGQQCIITQLETMEGPNTPEFWQIVGDREWELADLNGYRRGTHYRVARKRRRSASIKAGRAATESGHIQSLNANRTKESYDRARRNISISLKEKYSNEDYINPLIGKKHSNETKAKISETLKIFTTEEEAEIFNKYIPRKYTHNMLALEYNIHYRTIQAIIKRHKKKGY